MAEILLRTKKPRATIITIVLQNCQALTFNFIPQMRIWFPCFQPLLRPIVLHSESLSFCSW